MASVSPPSEPTSRLRRAVLHHTGSFGARGRGFQWSVMLLLSAVFAVLLEALRLPAALLLGPMIAAILVAADPCGRLRRVVACAALAILRGSSGDRLHDRALHHPQNRRHDDSGLAVVPSCGLLRHRGEQCDRLAADTLARPARNDRRVGIVSGSGLRDDADGRSFRCGCPPRRLHAIPARRPCHGCGIHRRPDLGDAVGWSYRQRVWFPPMEWASFRGNMALAGVGASLPPPYEFRRGRCWCRWSPGALLHGPASMTIELPPWLLAVSYAIVGWNIGMRFTRPILVHALRALPRVAASILVLIAICGGFAWVLTWMAGIVRDGISRYQPRRRLTWWRSSPRPPTSMCRS